AVDDAARAGSDDSDAAAIAANATAAAVARDFRITGDFMEPLLRAGKPVGRVRRPGAAGCDSALPHFSRPGCAELHSRDDADDGEGRNRRPRRPSTRSLRRSTTP